MRLAIGNVANTGCYTIVQLNAERLSTFLCMIQLHFRHAAFRKSEYRSIRGGGRMKIQIVRHVHVQDPAHIQTVFQFFAYTGRYSRFRTSYMMTSYQSNRDENHSMAWHHSARPCPASACLTGHSKSPISSRVESCSCEREVQAVARRLHGMFSRHHAQHAAILGSHAPTIPRMHGVFLGPRGWQLPPAESRS